MGRIYQHAIELAVIACDPWPGFIVGESEDGGLERLSKEIQDLRPVLRRVAVMLGGSASEAEDLVHDAIERGLLNWSKFDGRNLRGWLITILRRLFYDRCRREARLPSLVELNDDSQAAVNCSSGPAWAVLGVEDIKRELAKLSPKLSETYRLRAFEDLSYSEIADKLQIPIDTVSSRLGRARRGLRKLLAAEIEKRSDR